MRGVGLCPFFRTPTPNSEQFFEQSKNKRMEVDDAYAIHNVGCCYGDGLCGCHRITPRQKFN